MSDSDETPHVSSLRPVSGRGFSMRRLLNGASLALAGVLLVALAIHWLPNVLPDHHSPQATPSAPSGNALLPLSPGSGWRPIGPDWGMDVAFTANGALGYVCGALPPEPLTFFGFYDVHQQSWIQFPTPATVGGGCRVSVSPIDLSDVVLVAFSTTPLVTQVFRSHDSGETWTPVPLSTSQIIGDIGWTNNGTLLAAEDISTVGANKSPTFTLYVSREHGPLAEIPAGQLIGRAGPLGRITIQSSGTMLYASVDGTSCSSYCTTLVRSGDDGLRWSPIAATYQGHPLVLAAAQPNTTTLIGWAFDPQSSMTLMLCSGDSGSTWQRLPAFPVDPRTSGEAILQATDGAVYAFCYLPANRVYALGHGTTHWAPIAPLPDGAPVAVQQDSAGHAVAFWAQAHARLSDALTPGLEYFPLAGK